MPTIVTVPLTCLRIRLPGYLSLSEAACDRKAHKKDGSAKALERIEFTAIPNKRQRRFITPEIRGVLTAGRSRKVLELLQDTKPAIESL